MIPDAPTNILWHYTYHCNFSCSHCYTRLLTHLPVLSPEEKALARQEIARAGVFQVTLSGGEDLLDDTLEETIRYLAAQGIVTQLGSNGWFLDSRRLADLRQAGLHGIQISLDHADPRLHDQIRRRRGSHERALLALRRGTAAGFVMEAGATVMPVNYKFLRQIAEMVAQAGAQRVNFIRWQAVGPLQDAEDTLSLTADQYQETLESLADLKKSAPLEVGFNYQQFPVPGYESACPCGRQQIVVRANGDLSPCTYSELIIGNILRDDLRDVWRDSEVLQGMRQNDSCLDGIAPDLLGVDDPGARKTG